MFKDYAGAIANAKLAEAQLEGVVGIIYAAQHNFYYSLALLAQYPEKGESEQEQVLSQVASNQEAMQNWAFHAPCNFKHKYDLVEAEKARVLGQTEKAMEYYDQAIQGAKEQGYIQDDATQEEVFNKIYYIVINKPKSILCLPIIYQSKL